MVVYQSLSLGASEGLHLNVVMVVGSSGQRVVRAQSPNANALGEHGVQHHHNEHDEHDVHQEGQIQNGDGPEAGLLQVALGGALDSVDDIQKPVATFGDKGLDVEGEPRLKSPETLKAEGGAKANVGDEEPGLARQHQTEDGAKGGDPGGDGVTLGLEIGGLDGGGGGGDGGLEVEEGGGEGEEEIVGEEEEEGLGEQEGQREEEEERDHGGRLERGEAVDRGAALEEGVGVPRHQNLVGQGHQEERDDQVQLQVFQALSRGRRRRERDGVEGLGGIRLRGLELVANGGDEVEHSHRYQSRGREHLVYHRRRHLLPATHKSFQIKD